MTDRAHLLASIAETVADYRTGELASPTPEHVDRWVCQFSKKVQVPLLRELDHVLNQTYFTRAAVSAFLGNLVTNNKLAGANPLEFWKSAIHRVLSAAGSRRSRDRAGRQRVAAGLLLQRPRAMRPHRLPGALWPRFLTAVGCATDSRSRKSCPAG